MSTANIRFYQFNEPALETGTYSLSIQEVVGTNNPVQTLDTFTQTQAFEVTGVRFSIPATTVTGEFPPGGNQGVFGNILPHVALNDPTLPWQRDPGGDPPVRSPWLALLTFWETDPMPAIQTVTASTITTGLPATTFFPTLPAESWQNPDETVNVIDVPLTLFLQIAPRLADLNLLAHVRETDVSAKSTQNGQLPPAINSVVTGIRFPGANMRTIVHLVSLEGYGEALPVDDNASPGTLPGAGYDTLRLVSLFNWNFISNTENESFTGYLESVTEGALQRPYTAPENPSDSDTYVQNALGMGYTALTHTLLTGEQTGSWYRGPLLPLGVANFIAPPYAASDQLLRYDPTTGMFDVTYAAAWQLGRLMALNNGQFAQALLRWKRNAASGAVVALENAALQQLLRTKMSEGSGGSVQQMVTGPLKAAVAKLNNTSTT